MPRVLVVNAGSSSLKLRVVEGHDGVALSADLGSLGPGTGAELAAFVRRAGRLDASGHRIVHGGPHHTGPVHLDDAVRAELDEVSALAPLHNPPALAAVDAVMGLLPAVPAVACFDTAFHATIPTSATTYALPAAWIAQWGIRRYGFHGLSCTWATTRAAVLAGGGVAPTRMVVCHLGAGASVTAVASGRSVDTTMGFTPLGGLVMATRPGDLDPGVVAFLVAHGVDSATLDDALEHRSGLAAIAGVADGDMRTVLARREQGDDAAALAVEVYLHRLRAGIAAMAAALGGLDTLVFTGGIGEHAPTVRAEACDGLGWLGVELDAAGNRAVADLDADIGSPGAAVRALVVHAREEVVIATQTRDLLAGQASAPPRPPAG